MSRTIRTAYSASREKYDAELTSEYRRDLREARAKVRRWERKVAMFGGEIHRATLLKMQARLAAI